MLLSCFSEGCLKYFFLPKEVAAVPLNGWGRDVRIYMCVCVICKRMLSCTLPQLSKCLLIRWSPRGWRRPDHNIQHLPYCPGRAMAGTGFQRGINRVTT